MNGPENKLVDTHPIQPVYTDKQGTLRFRRNEIVRYLLDNGGTTLNHLASLPFSDEDRCQFAQLIGYSLRGYSELPYVSDEEYDRVCNWPSKGETFL